MDKGAFKVLLAAGAICGVVCLAYLAYSRPGYFTSQTYLGGLLALEFLAVAVWFYRRAFFPLVIVTFLLAGMHVPLSSVWTMARWGVLAAGGMIGSVIVFKERRFSFGTFHIIALFSILAALMSSAVSRFTTVSSLKVLSLLLLFAYASSGVRLAVENRESRFFTGLVVGCEILVGVIAISHFLGMSVLGNPNSLGAVMGVVGAPLLLWASLVPQETFTRRRRLALCAVAGYLTLTSHARASILAAFLSCAMLCLLLRKYKLLAQGIAVFAIVIASLAIVQPHVYTSAVSSFTTDVLYKGKDPSDGLLGSRQSPWQNAMDTIRDHFWFGTGFGTSDTDLDPTGNLGKFASTSLASLEHGSSYLAIVAWVGMLGVLPFILLLVSLFKRIVGTLIWTARTVNPNHPAVPLAIVLLAGLIHAGFEDWLFAPGYYLCTFFWSLAFIFVDQTAFLSIPQSRGALFNRIRPERHDLYVVAPGR